MKKEILDPLDAAELLARQQVLQSEAAAVLEDLNLRSVLSRIGIPHHNGSFASGLMVWRDIDLYVVSPGLSGDDAFDTMQPIAAHPRIHRVRYLNESGRFNPTGEPRDERYYFGLYYAPDEGEDWKIDVSLWLENLPRSELEDVQNLQKQLTAESRLAILWLKDVWHRLPAYRTQVFSMDIYDAVLRHNVQTPAELDRYLSERGKPARPG